MSQYLYLLSEDPTAAPTKIGRTDDPQRRLGEHRNFYRSGLLEMHAVVKVLEDEVAVLERELLDLTAQARCGLSEWRDLSVDEILPILGAMLAGDDEAESEYTRQPTKRLNANICESLHQRVKIAAIEWGVSITDFVIETLEAHLPATA